MDIVTEKEVNRILVVDALRGFALVSIMLLHNIEMFEVQGAKTFLPLWMVSIDKIVWDTFFFLFGGKSYAIFALLFGLTYYIQTHNQEEQGNDFRFRFLWRMFLLMGFGLINTLFYQGEILVLYAMVGIFLIPFNKMSNKIVFITALILLFQPILWCKLILAINNPSPILIEPSFMPFYMKVGDYLTGDSIFQLMKSNITNGRIASLLWFWENGRVDQSLGLFLMGFLAGRKRIFFNSPKNITLWKKILIISIIVFIPLHILKLNTELISNSKNIINITSSILRLWSNLALMLVLISGFILLFYNKKSQKVLDKLSPIGKMSLTNYILQSVVGACIYYGFGLGMYRYLGATYCLIIGIVLAIAMGLFSNYWMKKYKKGLFENLWHKLTWIGTTKSNLQLEVKK